MSHRTFRHLVVGVTTAAVLAGTAVASSSPAGARSARTNVPEVASLVSSMTLEEKIGQLFIAHTYGTSATTTDPADVQQNQKLYGVDNGAELVRKYHLGGVVYFTWTNVLTDPTQVAQLSNGLQHAATGSGAGVPLLVSADQEGGNVVRLGAPLAVSPGNMALGASGDPSLAYSVSHTTGEQLAALGINVNYAPVVDTNTNPANTADGPRSFSDDPAVTSTFGAASIRGLQAAHVAAAAKHFPGLGSTSINTDDDVAITNQTRQDFDRYDLPAFKAAIAAGTDQIMTAHIIAPALDTSRAPASLSQPMVTGILRDQLHYDGVVITDALNAPALKGYSDEQSAVKAVQAGNDLLLMPPNLARAQRAILDAVHDGTISVSRVDQSVTRILTQKKKLGLFENAQVPVPEAARAVGTPAQLAVMNQAAHRAMTLYRNDSHVLPLAATPDEKVLVTGYGVTTSTNLAADIQAKGVQVRRVYTGSTPSDAAIAAAVDAAKDADHAVVISNNAWNDPQQRKLITALQATGTPVIVLAVGAPYELGYLPGTPTFLASFGYQPVSMAAAADVLFSRQATGRSPITIRTPDGSSIVAARGSRACEGPSGRYATRAV